MKSIHHLWVSLLCWLTPEAIVVSSDPCKLKPESSSAQDLWDSCARQGYIALQCNLRGNGIWKINVQVLTALLPTGNQINYLL